MTVDLFSLAAAHVVTMAGTTQPVQLVTAGTTPTDIAAWVALGLAVALVVLRFVAPLTKTTLDDRVLAKLELLDQILFHVSKPAAATTTNVTVTPPAAAPPPLPPESTSIAGALLAVLLLGAIALSPACATVKAAPGVAGHAVIDCAKEQARPILELALAFAAQAAIAAIDQGSIDWGSIEDTAAREGKVLGGCAVSKFVAGLARAPRSDTAVRSLLTPPDPVADGRAAIARLSQRFDGATWQ